MSSSHHISHNHGTVPPGHKSSVPQGHLSNHHHYNPHSSTNDDRENHSVISGGGGSGRTKNSTTGNSREGGSSNRDNVREKERKRILNNVLSFVRRFRALNKALNISRAFFTWKTRASLAPFLIDPNKHNSSNTGVEDEEGRPSASKVNSYLSLFYENEKLRQQLKEQQRSGKATRQHAGAASIACLLRSRRRMMCRAYLDRWIQMCNIEAHRSSQSQKSTELKIGLQKLEVERALIQQLQSRSQKLSLALALGSYYSRWKARTAELKIRAERRAQQQQLVAIHDALVRVRATTQLTNQREAAAWSGALQTGRDLEGNLQAMMGQMQIVAGLLQKQGPDSAQLHSGDSNSTLNNHFTGTSGNLTSPPVAQSSGRQHRSISPKL